MKKILSSILLLGFLLNTGGFYFLFRIQQYHLHQKIEQERKANYTDKDLALIVVPLNDESEINWMEPHKEFSYRGEMYDVIKTKTINQHKHYYCINDSKEKQLIANYQKNHDSKKDIRNRLRRRVTKQFFANTFFYKGDMFAAEHRFFTISSHYKSIDIKTASPPPKFS